MKNKKLLAIILLSLSFCFVSEVGYGELREWMWEAQVKYSHLALSEARIDYMMTNPTIFLNIKLDYDSSKGFIMRENVLLPSKEGRIYILVTDNRGLFSDKSGVSLLDTFKKNLEVIYSFIDHIATDMNTDIVAILYSREVIPLAYFSQGEYHLGEYHWED